MVAGDRTSIATETARPSRPRRVRMPFALVAVLLAFYLPFLWAVQPPYSGSHRLLWLKLFPILPGFLPGVLFHPEEIPMLITMGLATLLLVASHTWMGHRSRSALLVASLIALIWSTVSSLAAYAAYRM